MRRPGPIRSAVLVALQRVRRRRARKAADYEELARLAGVEPAAVRTALKNMARAGEVHAEALEVRPGSPRARALYALGPAANDDGPAVLQQGMRAWG